MPRPKIPRKISSSPEVTYFKPRGIPVRLMEEVDLKIDELEALKLSDSQDLKMDEAAKSMKISKATFCRILNTAHKKIADALIQGKAIKIHLTQNNMPRQDGTGPNGEGPRTGRGLGPCDPGKNPKSGMPPRRGRRQGQGRGRA